MINAICIVNSTLFDVMNGFNPSDINDNSLPESVRTVMLNPQQPIGIIQANQTKIVSSNKSVIYFGDTNSILQLLSDLDNNYPPPAFTIGAVFDSKTGLPYGKTYTPNGSVTGSTTYPVVFDGQTPDLFKYCNDRTESQSMSAYWETLTPLQKSKFDPFWRTTSTHYRRWDLV